MRKELDEALCAKYPLIFRDRHANMQVTAMCWALLFAILSIHDETPQVPITDWVECAPGPSKIVAFTHTPDPRAAPRSGGSCILLWTASVGVAF